MKYEKELLFFQKTMERCGVDMRIVPRDAPVYRESPVRALLAGGVPLMKAVRPLAEHFVPGYIYHLADSFFLNYRFLLLPQEKLLVMGPYLCMQPSQNVIFSFAQKARLSSAELSRLENAYQQVPYLAENSAAHAMLQVLCETVWGGFCVRKLDLTETLTQSEAYHSAQQEDILQHMHLLEERYRQEQALLDAVAQGNSEVLERLLLNIGENSVIEQRLSDPVRNIKNYCIIFNTSLKKAAQAGGVHPVDLNEISGTFARRIELTAGTEEANRLMKEMARVYCEAVRRYALDGYSEMIQQAVMFIRHNLSANLTLNTVAAAVGKNASYLSARFRAETGMTITEYILRQRMRLALFLLSSTDLQVQTVAQYCGILDMNYFSKIFKKAMGQSPREYRRTVEGLHLPQKAPFAP